MRERAIAPGRKAATPAAAPTARRPSADGGLQHTVGNQAVQRALRLAVSSPGDRQEREADRVAAQVMTGARVGSAVTAGERSAAATESPSVPPVVGEVLQSPGTPLDSSARAFFEPRFGRDFGDVRVHADGRASESARAMGAAAYTVGSDIVFRSDRYAPGTAGGRSLLAHELTHVLQRTPGVLHRKLDCNIDHIITECAGAQAQCDTVAGYCKSYGTAADMAALHEKAVQGAESKKKTIPNAANNLLHFLGKYGGALGTELTMPLAIFKTHPSTTDKLENEHRDKFIEGAKKRLASGALTVGGSVDMVWTGTAQAFDYTETDLGLAVGGYTLCSKVTVSARAKGTGGDVEITFDKWSVQAFDCYNWDPGKGLGGLFGGVSDKDLCCIQNAGLGKHFRIRTAEWSNDDAASMASAIIAATPAPPTTPPKKPPSGEDDKR